MRTRLLYRDRDLRDAPPAPPRSEELRRNLGLDRLLPVMAAGDDGLHRVAEAVLLGDVASAEDIRYRHEVLRDCLAHPDAVDDLRRIAAKAVDRERHNYFGLFTRATPDKVLYRSLDVLDMFLEAFTELRAACDRWRGGFASAGFDTFFTCIATDLDDAYLTTVREHLEGLRFAKGELISVRLGAGAHGTDHVLRHADRSGWRRLRGRDGAIDLDVDDPAAAEALTVLAGRGIRTAADAVAQAAEHVAAYFRTIADELGFYRAVMNLLGALDERGAPLVPTGTVGAGPDVPWPLPPRARPSGAGTRCRQRHPDRERRGHDDHRREPRREDHAAAQHRHRPAHAALRHAGARAGVPRPRPLAGAHAFRRGGARRRRHRGAAGGGAGPDERHRRRDPAGRTPVVQRVARIDERA